MEGRNNRFLCMMCGSYNGFTRYIHGSASYSEQEIYSDESHIPEDYDDYNTNDHELQDCGAFKCEECGEEIVESDLSDKNWLELRMKHTDRKGDWHTKELPEKRWNKKLKAELLSLAF